jgi:protoporphyrinogen oxidase
VATRRGPAAQADGSPVGQVLVIGAGPCGLACARELERLGQRELTVVEAAAVAGGLAGSTVDPQGFTWDRGGHVVFSHYGEFDRLLDEALGADVEHHERSSFVHAAGRWVPYPFQNNLHHLPDELCRAALVDLIEAQHDRPGVDGPDDFGTWMRRQFGTTICELFMRPYNTKVWATSPERMSAAWMAERVPTLDWRRALANALTRTDDLAWGPNNKFAFPSRGGTGEIYRRVAASLRTPVRYDTAVVGVDARARRVVTTEGTAFHYDRLVWTGALDELVAAIVDVPAHVAAAADELVHNSVTIVGLGYRAPLSDERSWLYFPDPAIPFYRATNFAKYSAANVPDGRTDLYSSWMTEIASPPGSWLDTDSLAERVDAALRGLGLVPPDAPIATVHVDHIERAYPVPTIGRDAALAVIHPWLAAHGIVARGRFGAWKYELGNMDHAVKMGIDVARAMLTGTPEEAWSA